MMTIDEAIKHAERVAEANKSANCIECAEEHQQLADWLKELKAYKENQGDIHRKIKAIVRHYDYDCQREIFVEECAEAIQAVQKCKRSEVCTYAFANLVEEVADVLITAEQMRLYLGAERVDKAIETKVNRQIGRIEREIENETENL